jgi:hypothetical protein
MHLVVAPFWFRACAHVLLPLQQMLAIQAAVVLLGSMRLQHANRHMALLRHGPENVVAQNEFIAINHLPLPLQDIVLPTSTKEVAAAVSYYFSLVHPYRPETEDAVKIRVASRVRGIPMTNQYR